MVSKILIDVDEQGLSTIRVTGVREEFDGDVRDKLVKRFLEGGMFAFISRDSNNDAEIHSMNAVDVLDMILSTRGHLFNDSVSFKEFEHSIFTSSSMIESFGEEQSNDLLAKLKVSHSV